jgi:hypothetical protein
MIAQLLALKSATIGLPTVLRSSRTCSNLRMKRLAHHHARSSLRQSSAQDFGEDNGVVVLGVPGGIDEGERAIARSPPELGEPRAFVTKLLDVAAAELLETTRFVPEPFPEFCARRQLPLPLIELGLFA